MTTPSRTIRRRGLKALSALAIGATSLGFSLGSASPVHAAPVMVSAWLAGDGGNTFCPSEACFVNNGNRLSTISSGAVTASDANAVVAALNDDLAYISAASGSDMVFCRSGATAAGGWKCGDPITSSTVLPATSFGTSAPAKIGDNSGAGGSVTLSTVGTFYFFSSTAGKDGLYGKLLVGGGDTTTTTEESTTSSSSTTSSTSSTTTTVASTTSSSSTTTSSAAATTTAAPTTTFAPPAPTIPKAGLAASKIATYLGMQVPKGAKVSATVAAKSKKVCRVLATRVLRIASGTCTLTVSVTASGKTTRKTTSVATS